MKKLTNKKKEYITRRQHSGQPAGSKCLVWRTKKGLHIKYKDGQVVILKKPYFAEGLEDCEDSITEAEKLFKMLDWVHTFVDTFVSLKK
jgi:hypothetical protein